MTACVPRPVPTSDLLLLTRRDCPATLAMRTNLDAALTALGRPLDYPEIDLDALSSSHPFTGYSPPTVLFRGRDLFGMPEPTPLFPEPS